MDDPKRIRSHALLAFTLLIGLGLAFALPAWVRAQVLVSTALANHSKVEIALEYLRENKDALGLRQGDLLDIEVIDEYVSSHTGVTHIYLRQRFQGIEVYNAMINVNIDVDDQVLSVGNRFIPDLANAIAGNPVQISATDAVLQGAAQSHIEITNPLLVLDLYDDPSQTVTFRKAGIALENVTAKLVYQPLENGQVRLAWDFAIYELDGQNWWSMRVDATDGRILDRYNQVLHDIWADPISTYHPLEQPDTPDFLSYLDNGMRLLGNQAILSPDAYFVYPAPMESPNHLIPPAPDDPPNSEDHRSLEVNPASDNASPFGWHDTDGAAGAEYTITRGNNVHAYEDSDGNNLSSGNEPDGGASLVFSYTLDLTQEPSTYRDASVTNLFYWNNIIHDVFFEYGFNEVSGNFQENNYGNGGTGSDSVIAEAQDGSGTCNANFATPADGGNPRMQMYVCEFTTPTRDGDLDNGVIIHEYGHGISIRLTGGPSTTSCLSNQEQMGEGWSDYLGLWATIEQGDFGNGARGMGTYLIGQASTGAGIRPAPYSTNFGVNSYTYDDIKSVSIPHGVGFVWASMLWDMSWALIDQYGFDPDLYNGTGGNNLALQLVMDGMKLQPCSPGFVDGRDAILQADVNLTGGANQCTIWEAFAGRGLGYSASQGNSNNRADGTEAFDLPPICLQALKLTKTADPSSVNPGGIFTYTLVAVNDTSSMLTDVIITDTVPLNTTYIPGSASNGGVESNGVVSYPAVTLSSGEAITRTFQVSASDNLGTVEYFYDDFENGFGGWTMTGLWNGEKESDTCGATKAPFPSSSNALYYGKDEDCNYNTGEANSGELTLATPVDLTGAATAQLTFWSYETTEKFLGYDQRIVEISTNGGSSWTPLQQLTNEDIWYQVSIDLTPYVGNDILLRFRFDSLDEINNDYFGWMVDNVAVVEEVFIYNTACVMAAEGDFSCDDVATKVSGEVAITPGVILSENDTLTGDPGSTVTYTVSITNTGNATDNFTLSMGGNSWNTTSPAIIGPLAVGASTSFHVMTDIPSNALGGDESTATLTATSQNDGNVTASIDLTTMANSLFGVTLSGDDAQAGDPGSTVTYTVSITNTGNAADVFDLSVIGNSWNTTSPGIIGPLAVGASTSFNVTTDIPPNALGGDESTATIAATSQNAGNVTASIDLTTTAKNLYGVDVSADAALTGTVGTVVTYRLQITNTGNTIDSFNLIVSGNQWGVSAPSMIGPLAAGTDALVAIEVTVDPNASEGDVDFATLKVASNGDPVTNVKRLLTTTAQANSYLIYIPLLSKP